MVERLFIDKIHDRSQRNDPALPDVKRQGFQVGFDVDPSCSAQPNPAPPTRPNAFGQIDLAARILRLANSTFMNPSGSAVTDLNIAITRLGHQLVRCTAVAFALQQMKFGGRSAELRPKLQALWRVGMLVAAIAYVIARESRAARPEEAMLTGLMHNIGRLYITVNSPGGGADGERTEIPAEVMDEWHPRMAASILKHWKFPAPIVTAVGNQTTMERPPGISIGLSNVLIAAIALVPSVFRRELVDEIATTIPAFQDLGLTADDCRRVMTASAQPIRSLQAALQG